MKWNGAMMKATGRFLWLLASGEEWWVYFLMTWIPIALGVIAYFIYIPGGKWYYASYAFASVSLSMAVLSCLLFLAKVGYIIWHGIWRSLLVAVVSYFGSIALAWAIPAVGLRLYLGVPLW